MREFALRHDGALWYADDGSVAVAAETLGALEDVLTAVLQEQLGIDFVGEVAMRFDLSRLPIWLRQYQAHYFNYRLRIGVPVSRANISSTLSDSSHRHE
jgi:hypothetical protein